MTEQEPWVSVDAVANHLGIARELSAWFKRPLAYPELKLNLNEASEGKLVESLECPEPELCPHYRGYSLKGVAMGESPAWLKQRIKAIGLRPINNVVDVTNYVLHETGQPLHAFDVSKIRGGKVIVRKAEAGEKIVTLDEKERALVPEDLVIDIKIYCAKHKMKIQDFITEAAREKLKADK